MGLGGMGGGLVDSREEWGEEGVGLGELDPGAVLSVDGPDVTNKILPTFFPPFFCQDGVLIWFFGGGLFTVLAFLVERPSSKFFLFLFLAGGSFSLSPSSPTMSSSFLFIS